MEKPLLKTILLKGESGDSIASLTKVSQVGAIATYRITLTSGDTFDFQVTNGTSIATIEKTATSGLVDTYTITLTDGSTSTFQVTNGQDGAVTNIDTELDPTSDKPIANSAVAQAINAANEDIGENAEAISSATEDITALENLTGFLSDNIVTDYAEPITVSGNPVLSGSVTKDLTQLAAGTYLVFYRFDIFDINLNQTATMKFKFSGTSTSGASSTSATLKELGTQFVDYTRTYWLSPAETCSFTTAVLLNISESTTPQMSIDYEVLSTSSTSSSYKANVYMTAIKIR